MSNEMQQLLAEQITASEKLHESHAAEIESVARQLPPRLLLMLPPLTLARSTNVPSSLKTEN